MIIESLRLFYHIRCFKCCVCRYGVKGLSSKFVHFFQHELTSKDKFVIPAIHT